MNHEDRYGENWCESSVIAEEAALAEEERHTHEEVCSHCGSAYIKHDNEHQFFDDSSIKEDNISFARKFCLLLSIIMQTAEYQPDKLFIIIAVAAGMSQAEAGRRLGIQRQMVHKHVKEIADINPVLAEYMQHNRAEVGYIINGIKPNELRTDFRNKVRGVLYGKHRKQP